MYSTAVVNSSPLIFLSRGGHLNLLRSVASHILVPNAVISELMARGGSDVTVESINRAEWIRQMHAIPISANIQSWGLGMGESSVIELARSEPESVAVIDDLAGRHCAAALDIPVVGTLGVVLSAKRKGVLNAARPVLEDLLRGGMYLSRSILDEALALVGE